MVEKKKPTQVMMDPPDHEQDTTEVVVEAVQPSTPAKISDAEMGANLFTLPSNGQLGYPAVLPYRDILVSDEEVLSSATVENYAQTLNGVLKDISGGAEFFEEITQADRDAFLIWLWASNYSKTKTVEAVCHNPKCETEKYEFTVDFTQVDITDVNPKFTGTYTLKLKSGGSVGVKLNTVSHEMECAAYLAKLEKMNAENKPSIRSLMNAASLDFGVELPVEKKYELMREKLTAAERTKVVNFHRTLQYGVPSVIDHKCPSCGGAAKSRFPFDLQDIIQPNVPADVEEFL